MDRQIISRPGVGTTALVLQNQPLRFSRVTTVGPAIIRVRHGQKVLHAPGFECTLGPGDAIAIAQDQVFDLVNTPGPDGRYQADMLIWDPGLIRSYAPKGHDITIIDTALPLSGMPEAFHVSFEAALQAVRDSAIPQPVALSRAREVLAWLEAMGAQFQLREPTTTSAHVRRHITSAPDAAWVAADLAAQLAMSEATLRRRLAEEDTTLGDLIADVRMSYAMQLLQSTHLPVSRIALDVGYDSASRFAIRFRRRFGFAPSAVRGHRREKIYEAKVTHG